MIGKKITTILSVVLFAGNGLYAVPVDKIFTSSGQILPGEEWENVFIHNDGTIVDMIGGDVDGIATYDASMVNVTGGHVNTLDALEFSTVNISGGYVYGLFGKNQSIVTFSGLAAGRTFGVEDWAILTITGGVLDYLGAMEQGTLNIRGGVVSDSLGAWDSANVNIYGYGFTYDPSGGSADGGQLRGFYLNGSSFILDLYGAQTYTHINLVPEPATLLLLGFGIFVLRQKR